MGEDKDTKEKLLASAKQEFLEKGYMKASLRTICKNAGVTTGALYFFFQGKEDLLNALVEEPLKGLIEIIQAHMSEELESNIGILTVESDSNDIRAAKEVVSFMYKHYDIFMILLTKSQGSTFEDIASRFADISEVHYKKIMAMAAEKFGVAIPDDYMTHWLSHMLVNAFTHILIHEKDVEKALKSIEHMVAYMLSGWNGMLTRGK